uniref:Large ribosomal subunit protein mL38 n=2 Tax=Timema TaxID=61471 RepID=A0A7R9PQ45_TIMGE|nr:unnamed protein product [Timema genevievae]
MKRYGTSLITTTTTKPPPHHHSQQNYQDPTLAFKVNIGFAQPKISRSQKLTERLKYLKERRADKDLEKLARTQQLTIPLDKVREEWQESGAAQHIKTVAEHYGVFQHLYGDAYFFPQVMLDVRYRQQGDDCFAVVHRGNVIKPAEAAVMPEVSYKANPDSLWTLLLTNLDGHLMLEDSEYVHWFVGNIPGNDVGKGEVICDYLQPFPPKGTGFHRLVFVLYKQEKRMDYGSLKRQQPCLCLEERTFRTQDFYRERQDDLTPAGLAFFQSDWDPSLTDFFHNTLEMQEPIYEYDFPPPYIRPQEWFPLKRPFNTYMDKYRDEKQIAKEYLLKKLKKTHPFRKPDPPPKYPHAFRMDLNLPSWLRVEKKKERLGWGRVNEHS